MDKRVILEGIKGNKWGAAEVGSKAGPFGNSLLINLIDNEIV